MKFEDLATKTNIALVVIVIAVFLLVVILAGNNNPTSQFDRASLETAVRGMDSTVVSCPTLNGNSLDCVYMNNQSNKTGMVRLIIVKYSYLGQEYVGISTDKVFYEIGKVS